MAANQQGVSTTLQSTVLRSGVDLGPLWPEMAWEEEGKPQGHICDTLCASGLSTGTSKYLYRAFWYQVLF